MYIFTIEKTYNNQGQLNEKFTGYSSGGGSRYGYGAEINYRIVNLKMY